MLGIFYLCPSLSLAVSLSLSKIKQRKKREFRSFFSVSLGECGGYSRWVTQYPSQEPLLCFLYFRGWKEKNHFLRLFSHEECLYEKVFCLPTELPHLFFRPAFSFDYFDMDMLSRTAFLYHRERPKQLKKSFSYHLRVAVPKAANTNLEIFCWVKKVEFYICLVLYFCY